MQRYGYVYRSFVTDSFFHAHGLICFSSVYLCVRVSFSLDVRIRIYNREGGGGRGERGERERRWETRKMGVKGWAGGKGKGEAEGRLSCPVAAATMCGHTLEAQTSREPTPQSQAHPGTSPGPAPPTPAPDKATAQTPTSSHTKPHPNPTPSPRPQLIHQAPLHQRPQHRAQPRPGCEPPESEPRADRPNISKKESEQGPPMPKTNRHNFDSNLTFRIFGTCLFLYQNK